MKILTMMLADAADERLIPANPIQPRRRGRRRHQRRPEQLWATPEQVVAIALQAIALVGLWAAILIITAAWTGARWGELAGLQRINTHLDDGVIVIDPDIGALHEINGHFELGPPKTAASARTITLPPFLITLLRAFLDTHQHPHVFVTADHQLLRRSNFARRAMRPAADGNLDRIRPRVRTQPVVPGLHFHGLRHGHKTWMIADGIPEVGQARRLGHEIPDDIREIYSHVAPEVEARILQAPATLARRPRQPPRKPRHGHTQAPPARRLTTPPPGPAAPQERRPLLLPRPSRRPPEPAATNPCGTQPPPPPPTPLRRRKPTATAPSRPQPTGTRPGSGTFRTVGSDSWRSRSERDPINPWGQTFP
ncbi:site-specific integrase [Amycolatopsis sacchari]|uniref:site-specific integrase n=1 Tax=Amycolatopsis sacchari TaxID=115433 RepID=UPI003D739302